MGAKPEYAPAPVFEAVDSHDRKISLADYKGGKNVVLVFNRGFG